MHPVRGTKLAVSGRICGIWEDLSAEPPGRKPHLTAIVWLSKSNAGRARQVAGEIPAGGISRRRQDERRLQDGGQAVVLGGLVVLH